MVAAYARGGLLQRLLLLGGQAVESGLEVALLQFQFGHRRGLQAVEARGVLQHRRVAARAHVGQDGFDALLDGFVLVGAPVQARRKPGFKIGLRGRQAQGGSSGRHGGKAPRETGGVKRALIGGRRAGIVSPVARMLAAPCA